LILDRTAQLAGWIRVNLPKVNRYDGRRGVSHALQAGRHFGVGAFLTMYLTENVTGNDRGRLHRPEAAGDSRQNHSIFPPPRHAGYTRGMSIVLPALAVAFAGFCVWLAVRIFNRRERWAKWTLAAVVGLPVLYVASFGPACWLTSQVDGGGWMVPNPALRIYWPLGRISRKEHTDSRCGQWLRWWMTVGLTEGRCAVVPTDSGGSWTMEP
jgi:hypothetical protein